MELNPIADSYNCVVVYPDGYKKSWNDGRGDGPAADKNIDDVGFISKLIETIQKNYNIDNKRIYILGMSNGGFMTMRLACDLSDKIAAVASVTSSMGLNPETWCFPSRALSVMLIGGTSDPVVPYEGGEIEGGSQCIGFPKTFNFWADKMNCFGYSEEKLSKKDANEDTSIELLSYSNCDSDSELLLYKVVNGGNTWPGGTQYLGEKRIGKVSHQMEANEVIVDFL